MPHPNIIWVYWITIPIGLAMFSIAIWAVRSKGNDVEKGENPLDDIKAGLVKINALETRIAKIKAQQKCPESVGLQIHDDAMEIWGDINKVLAPIFSSIIGKQDPDPLINFFKTFGDILDNNKYGLKDSLEENNDYNLPKWK